MLQWRHEPLQHRADLGPEKPVRRLLHCPCLYIQGCPRHLVSATGDVLDRLHLRALGERGHAVLEGDDLAGQLRACLSQCKTVCVECWRKGLDPINQRRDLADGLGNQCFSGRAWMIHALGLGSGSVPSPSATRPSAVKHASSSGTTPLASLRVASFWARATFSAVSRALTISAL